MNTPRSGSNWGEQHHCEFGRWRCHWRRLGAPGGPALVLLHGFGAASGHWRSNVAGLAAAGYCVYAIDLLGFGQSDQPAIALDNRLWSRQLQQFLREVVQVPALLVGNSLGGLVAITTAVFAPELVRAVVAAPLPDPTLLQALPKRRPRWKRQLERFLLNFVAKFLPLGPLIALLRQTPLLRLGIKSAYANPERINLELVRLIQQPARRKGAAGALAGMVRGMGLRPAAATAPELLPRLKCPLLLLWGKQDRLVPAQIGQKVLALSPKGLCELQLMAGLGHCPHDEDPERFNELLLSWEHQRLGLAGPKLGQ